MRTTASGTPAHTFPSAPQLRHLAPNVVSLFADERPSVVNPPRLRGRLPRNVVSLNSRQRLAVGDVCEICRGAFPENYGKRVRVVGFDDEGFVMVDAVSAPLWIYSLETGERIGCGWRSRSLPQNLRRVRKGDGK